MIGVKNQQYLKEFGKHLRKLRKKKKLSMKHLADLANLEYSQIARIEAGKINTTISTLKAIAEALEIHPKKLLDI